MSNKRKNKNVFSSPPGRDGGVRFAYLYVVQEFYEPFVNKYRIPRPRDLFCIHGIPIRSGMDYIREALEHYDPPIIVEAPLVSAANILTADEEFFRFIGVTYLISPLSNKCGLYYNVRKPEQDSPASGGGIQLLLHTGDESIATIMAETHAIVHEWAVDFAEKARKIDVGDYTVIYKYVEELLSSAQPPALIAFLLSGKLHHEFLKKYRDAFGGIENLTHSFFDILFETSDQYKPLKVGIPGTVLVTRTSDLAQYQSIIQRFVDVWFEYLQNLSKSEMSKYINEWRFQPVSWTKPSYIRNAILFTDFVLNKFKEKKLRKMRSLPIACYEPLWPINLKDEQKKKAQKDLVELHENFARRSLERFDPTAVTGGKRVQNLQKQAALLVDRMGKIITKPKDKDFGQNLQEIAEYHRKLDRLIDDYLEIKRRQNGTCASCAEKCSPDAPTSNNKIVLQILVWQAQFAKYFHDIKEACITQEKLLTGELADCYRELVENLTLGDEDWLKKSISVLRGIFNDYADNPKWIDNMQSNRHAPAKYYLTLGVCPSNS